MNTTLNGTAIFNCTYVGDVVLWEANGQKIASGFEITEVLLPSNLVMSKLSVVTSLDKNNTNITCTAIAAGSKTNKSEPALLLLQGKHQFYTGHGSPRHTVHLHIMSIFTTYYGLVVAYSHAHDVWTKNKTAAPINVLTVNTPIISLCSKCYSVHKHLEQLIWAAPVYSSWKVTILRWPT